MAAKSISEKLQEIHSLAHQRKHKEAKTRLERLLKKGNFTPENKRMTSTIYLVLGDFDKMIKVLGQEMSLDDMKELRKEELAMQYQLGAFIIWIGARYTGRRICRKFVEVCQSKGKEPKEIHEFYDRIEINLMHTQQLYDEMLEASEIMMSEVEEGGVVWKWAAIRACKALKLTGPEDHWKKTLDEFGSYVKEEDTYAYPIFHNCLGEWELIQGNYAKARENYQKAIDLTKEGEISLYGSFNNMNLGVVAHEEGKKEEAVRYCRRSFDIAQELRGNAFMTLFNLYWLEKSDPEQCSIEEKIAVRCHHCNIDLSFLLGKRYRPEIHPKLSNRILAEYEEQFKDTPNDCWLVENGSIRPVVYKEQIQATAVAAVNEPLWDLHAGLVLRSGKVESVITEAQLRCLAPIIGSGVMGISKWAIIDIVYREEEYCFNYGEERIKFLLGQLKKQGHAIKRSKNYYYCTPPKGSMFLPMEVPTARPEIFLQAVTTTFQRQDVEHLFSLHKATANRWIKDWMEKGILEKADDGYKFVNP